MMPLKKWLRTRWRGRKRQDLIGQYRSLAATCPLVVADVASRGFIYADLVGPTDRETWINIGRRQMALELLQLARMSPDDVRELLDQEREHG